MSSKVLPQSDMSLRPDRVKGLPFLINRLTQAAEQASAPRCGLFLGAGCSVSSGIPSGGRIADLCRAISFAENSGAYPELMRNRQEDFDQFCDSVRQIVAERSEEYREFVRRRDAARSDALLSGSLRSMLPANMLTRIVQRCEEKGLNVDKEIQNTLGDALLADAEYGYWLEAFSEDPRDRQWLIERLINGRNPSAAYILLSKIIAKGVLSNVFTTNFDDLLNDTLLKYCGVKARVYAHNEIVRFLTITGTRPNIIKLHGDFLFEDIRNVARETRELLPNMKAKLCEALRLLDLVVVGYRGADHSIMSALEELKTDRPFGLIWCGRDPDRLHWRVVNLLNSTSNSYFVRLESFDNLMEQLWSSISGSSIHRAQLAMLHQLETVALMWQQVAMITEQLRLSMDEGSTVFASINEDYSERLAALNYTYTHDDIIASRTSHADIIIVGLSQTYKSTVSQQLAFRGYWVANVPVTSDSYNSLHLAARKGQLIVFFRMDTAANTELRRLRNEGFGGHMPSYADPMRVLEDQNYATKTYLENRHWELIDVTDKSIGTIVTLVVDLARRKGIYPRNVRAL